MRLRYVMRYYHPFPEAIPLLKAGCSRVTHPSATMSIKQAQLTPFDLHVLGVPPAFVLSQDQTLHRVVSPIGFTRSEICLIANRSQLLLRFIVLSDFSKYNAEQISSFRIDQGFQFYSCLFFSRIVQFSRCSRCRFQGAYLVRRLIYYTTF